MKTKLAAILLMAATIMSILAFVYVQRQTGSELWASIAAVGFYVGAFLMIAAIFNAKAKKGEEKSSWQELKELQVLAKKAAEDEAAKKAAEEKAAEASAAPTNGKK